MLIKITKNHRKIKPTLSLIKAEHIKNMEVCLSYDKKLSEASNQLNFIEKRNKDLQNEITFLTKVFNALRKLTVNLEMQSEYFEVFHSENFSSLEIISKIESALSYLSEFNSVYNIRVIEERKEEISKTLKIFYKKFTTFFNEKLSKIESTSRGELKIHTFIYEEVKIYENIFQFASVNFTESFIQLISIYKDHNTKIYKKEFENHLKVIYKVFQEKKGQRVKEIFDIFYESFFLIIKAEVHFCKKHVLFSKVNLHEFVSDMFYDVIDYLIYSLNNLFEKLPVELIDSLEMNYSFEFVGEEKEIWKSLVSRMEEQRKLYEKRFISEEKDNFLSRSREKNLEFTLYNLTKRIKEPLRNELIEIEIDDILREDDDIEDKIKILRMLYLFSDKVKHNKIEFYINEKLKELEKEIIAYVFADEEKSKRRIERLFKQSANEKRVNEFIKFICEDNCDDEFKSVIDEIYEKFK